GEPHPRIAGNCITENGCTSGYSSGGGIRCYRCAAEIINNTVVANSAVYGGGIYIYCSSQEMVNTVFWNNQAESGSQIYLSAYSGNLCEPSIRYSVIQGGVNSVYIGPYSQLHFGDDVSGVDPGFVQLENGDHHLRFDSPCRNTGDSSVAGLPMLDFEGDPRVADAVVDKGADEYYTHLYCAGDFRPWGYVELKILDTPGSGPVFLWAGIDTLASPLPTPYGDWYLQLPLLLDIGLGSIPPEGYLYLFVLVPPDILAPVSLPLQAFTGTRLTNYYELKIEPL
ncbi:MAG: right-handed parallel beta-helix repeat-containing protein, partial [Planctomycetota bacterium]